MGLLTQIFFSKDKIFFITTHSSIVLKHLGSFAESRIFKVTIDWEGKVPESAIVEIGDDPKRPQVILEDLGYEYHDFGLWRARLILEESTAESIINEILIPGFAPKLIGQIRTISTNGNSSIIPIFEDCNRLFLFTHFEQFYKNKSSVCIDGDKLGLAIVEDLNIKYIRSGWNQEQFLIFSSPFFEAYYPPAYLDKF